MRYHDNLDQDALDAEIKRVTPIMQAVHQDTIAARASIMEALPKALPKVSNTKFRFEFLASPVQMFGDADGNLTQIELEENILVESKGETKAKGNGNKRRLEVETVIFAIGDKVDESFGLPTEWNEFIKSETPRFPIDGNSYESTFEDIFVGGWSRKASSGLVGYARKDGTNAAKELWQYLQTKQPIEPNTDTLAEKLKSLNKPLVLKEHVKKLDEAELAQAKQRITELELQLEAKQHELAASKNAAGDREKIFADLAAAKQRASDLESELARRDQEMASLKGALDQQKTSLAEAKDDLSKLLQAEVAKGNVTMKQLGDQLTLGLATTLLFDSGEATLKPGGADVLHRIGGVLKHSPDRSIQVTGHTDNVPIKGRLAKTYPTNLELSQARAESARQALTEGGMAPDKIEAKGRADSRPIASNSTAEGRQKNRRVEIVVGH